MSPFVLLFLLGTLSSTRALDWGSEDTLIQISGGVLMQGGSLTDLKSLFRQGPAVVRRAPGGVLFLEVTVGMRRVHVTYNKYLLHLDDEKFSGTVQADVSPATVSAQLQLQPPCRVLIRSLRVATLGPLRINATGLGPFSNLPKLLEELFARPSLRTKLEDAALQFASRIVQHQLDKLACK